MNKFKVEVIADNSGKWSVNAMKYDTFQEAKDAALDLAGRWVMVTKARVVEYDPAIEADNDPLAGRYMRSAVKETVVF